MMMHKDLTPERWFKFSLMEQLANVGMDVERAIKSKRKGDLEASRQDFDRALELMLLTIRDPKNRGQILKKLCHMREWLVDHFVFDNEYGTTDEYWSQYFYEVAYSAAIARGR